MLKKIFLLFPLLSLLFLSCSGAEDIDYNILLHNRTGNSIEEIYIRLTNTTDWGSDKIAETILTDGSHLSIDVPEMNDSIYDIHLIDELGNDYYYWNFETSYQSNSYHYNNLAVTSDYIYESETKASDPENFYVINRTEANITEIYITPFTYSEWAGNLLTEPLTAGESTTFNISNYVSQYVDTKAVDENGVVYTILYTQGAYNKLAITPDYIR